MLIVSITVSFVLQQTGLNRGKFWLPFLSARLSAHFLNGHPNIQGLFGLRHIVYAQDVRAARHTG